MLLYQAQYNNNNKGLHICKRYNSIFLAPTFSSAKAWKKALKYSHIVIVNIDDNKDLEINFGGYWETDHLNNLELYNNKKVSDYKMKIKAFELPLLLKILKESNFCVDSCDIEVLIRL